mgnify:CR=1 FL=1
MSTEFNKFLINNKKQFDRTMKQFDAKSKDFDKKINRILSLL